MTTAPPAHSPSEIWPQGSPSGVFGARRARLRALLAERGVRCAALTSGWARPRNFAHNVYPFRAESHFLYLIGRALEGAVLELSEEGDTLFVTPSDPGSALWHGPQPTLEQLADELGVAVRPIDDLEPREHAVLPPQDEETGLWLGALLDRDVVAGGGEELEGADEALADAMVALRLRHDAAAVAQLRQAAAVTVAAHRAGMARSRVGLREAAVRAAMEERIVACGMCPAYGSIVTVQGEVLHDTRHHRVLSDGELLLADVGAETPEGWAADVTRTWPVSGRFSTTQREAYEAVLTAQRAAIERVRPGARYLDVHRAAGQVLARCLVEIGILRGDPLELHARGVAALFFPHGVGHLLGLDVHDMEDLGDRAGYAPGRERSSFVGDAALRLDRDLEAGMLVTIEPGLYRIPQLWDDAERLRPLADAIDFKVWERFSDVRGIRIEDDVLVTAEGCDVLTAGAPKELAEVEAAVGAAR